ncbi:MAG TPA: hypothetical protein VH158_07820 [Gemmatimonadales bacterium]|nr:hypothetical protein [Gemmatimonadales bacterium]
MNGCLKGVLRLGCLVLVLAAALAVWWFREPLGRTARRVLGVHPTQLPPIADTVGAPTPKALSSTQTKLDRLKKTAGPDSIVLSANEIASLVGSGIDWSVRKSFDSLRVELLEGKVAVDCRLDTRVIPPEALGPLAGMLQPREPLRIAGPLTVARPGIVRFTVEELALRGFPFTQPVIKQLAQRVAGADSTGSVLLRVGADSTRAAPLRLLPLFTDIAIHPTGVVLYRTKRRKP